MQLSVNATDDRLAVLASVSNYTKIRVFTSGTLDISLTPVDELLSIVEPWSIASAASILNSDWQYFSAVCWFFWEGTL